MKLEVNNFTLHNFIQVIKQFSVEHQKKLGEYFGFGFTTVWDWLSSSSNNIGTVSNWFGFSFLALNWKPLYNVHDNNF